jgi:hypothetical protein
MQIHDWTLVEANLFHHFHHGWCDALGYALNAGRLPSGYFALVEQVVSGPIPDVLTLRQKAAKHNSESTAVLTVPPQTRFVQRAEVDIYARKANQVTVRHQRGDVVAVIEIVSPGNNSSCTAVISFVTKMVDLLHQGIHLLIVDLFPPGPRDPDGIHKLIWDEIEEGPFELPPDRPLTLVAYEAGPVKVAYVEPISVGDRLPDMPVFLAPENHVLAPLEATYRSAWNKFPDPLKNLLDGSGESKA